MNKVNIVAVTLTSGVKSCPFHKVDGVVSLQPQLVELKYTQEMCLLHTV